MTGKYATLGSGDGAALGTTGFSPTFDGFLDMCDEFYKGGLRSIAKASGAATYADQPGMFNAVYGQQITAGMFIGKSIASAMGAKPYDHEGVRIATGLATTGLRADGSFGGLGAGVVQDGRIPDPVKMPVGTFRMPYKELAMTWDYGTGLHALESRQDDTAGYKDYSDLLSKNFYDLMDKTYLRPLDNVMPVETDYFSVADGRGAVDSSTETSLTGIARAIANGKEADGTKITEEMVSPYGGASGDFYAWRKGGAAHVTNNLDGKVVDTGGNPLSLGHLHALYRSVTANWDDVTPNGKFWAMSTVAVDALAALAESKNIKLGEVYEQKSFNGAKTLPGRDYGFMMNSWLQIPILPDNNLAFDYNTSMPSISKMGDVYLLDTDHLWLSVLTPVEVHTADNPILLGSFREKNLIRMRAELRCDKFIGQGRIVGLPEDVAVGADYTLLG